jgi:hypothetical protein
VATAAAGGEHDEEPVAEASITEAPVDAEATT